MRLNFLFLIFFHLRGRVNLNFAGISYFDFHAV